MVQKMLIYIKTDYLVFLLINLSGYEPEYDPKLWNHPYIEGSHKHKLLTLDDIVPSTIN